MGFFKEDGSCDVKDVWVNNTKETDIKYDGRNNYKAVLLNYGDFSFVKVRIDEESLIFFKNNLDKVHDIVARCVIW